MTRSTLQTAIAAALFASLALAEVFDGAVALPFAVLVSAEGGPE